MIDVREDKKLRGDLGGNLAQSQMPRGFGVIETNFCGPMGGSHGLRELYSRRTIRENQHLPEGMPGCQRLVELVVQISFEGCHAKADLGLQIEKTVSRGALAYEDAGLKAVIQQGAAKTSDELGIVLIHFL